MHVGDTVKFKTDKSWDDKIIIPKKYYTEKNGIPVTYIKHGSTVLGDAYFKNFGRIIAKGYYTKDINKKIYIVRWTSDENEIMQVGFDEENLIKVKSGNGTTEIIKSIDKNLNEVEDILKS